MKRNHCRQEKHNLIKSKKYNARVLRFLFFILCILKRKWGERERERREGRGMQEISEVRERGISKLCFEIVLEYQMS